MWWVNFRTLEVCLRPATAALFGLTCGLFIVLHIGTVCFGVWLGLLRGCRHANMVGEGGQPRIVQEWAFPRRIPHWSTGFSDSVRAFPLIRSRPAQSGTMAGQAPALSLGER